MADTAPETPAKKKKKKKVFPAVTASSIIVDVFTLDGVKLPNVEVEVTGVEIKKGTGPITFTNAAKIVAGTKLTVKARKAGFVPASPTPFPAPPAGGEDSVDVFVATGKNFVRLILCDQTKLHVIMHVTRKDGSALKDVRTEIVGQRGPDKTDATGRKVYINIPPNLALNYTTAKAGFGPVDATTGNVAVGFQATTNQTLPAGVTTLDFVLEPGTGTVNKITATVPGTFGVRVAGNQNPSKSFTSAVNVESAKTNAPAVLVRGCSTIQLSADTTPPGQPVDWQIKAIRAPLGNPTLTPTAGGKTATLATNKNGGFSISANLGASTIVWNVVFVWVKVLPKTGVIVNNASYSDSGSSATSTGFKSGAFAKGKAAMEASVEMDVLPGVTAADVTSLDAILKKVVIHYLQNGTVDSLSGAYRGGGVGKEVPGGGLPVLDANSAAAPLADDPQDFKITPASGGDHRTMEILDSPAGGFVNRHPSKTDPQSFPVPPAPAQQAPLLSISGVNTFVATVASVSTDAPGSVVVHAKFNWTADYTGSVNYPPPGAGKPATFIKNSSIGKYKATTAKTTVDPKFQLVSDATGGQDAKAAGIEVFPPVFNAAPTTNVFS